MDPRKDAVGVKAAISFLNSKCDLLHALSIKQICVAVINRYDQTEKGAEMTEKATDVLNQIETGSWIVRVSDIKQLSEYLFPKE